MSIIAAALLARRARCAPWRVVRAASRIVRTAPRVVRAAPPCGLLRPWWRPSLSAIPRQRALSASISLLVVVAALSLAPPLAPDAQAQPTSAAGSPAGTESISGADAGIRPSAGARATSAADPSSVPGALAEARRLLAQRRHDDALSAVDVGLRRTPGDAQLRFQKGVILADAGRAEQALELFRALTEEFPELPEPHNNLAALYAARGELDMARQALETALRALPSYALASENLGDIYLRLAERAWQHAADAEPGNTALKSKLTLARELIARVSPSGSRPAAAGTPSTVGRSSPAGTSSSAAGMSQPPGPAATRPAGNR